MPDSTQLSLSRQRRISGVPIVYRRGEIAIPLVAIPGASHQTIENTHGVLTTHRFEDWLVEAADLAQPEGEPLTPAIGDQVRRETPHGLHAYEVTEPDPATPAWRAVDTDGYWIRIHTHFIGTTR